MRIGINVADDLLERMKPLRGLSNLSQICREAIQARVAAYERARDRANEEGMEDVAKRLHQEYAEKQADWEALGHEDAKLWVQLASLQDFEDLFHNIKVFKREGRFPGIIPVSRVIPGTKTTLAYHWSEHKEWSYGQIELQGAGPAYDLGWLSYVTAVWQMVKARIAEDTQARDAALKQARADIQLPKHLANAGRAQEGGRNGR